MRFTLTVAATLALGTVAWLLLRPDVIEEARAQGWRDGWLEGYLTGVNDLAAVR